MTSKRYQRLHQEWLGLQRARVLTLVSLRDLNEQIEDLRLDLRNPPLSEFTPYLGGTSEKPGMISGQWVERYFDEALAEDIVTEEELAAA